ncbi:MAG TPA: hypothetical protein VFE46_12040 [Pirellulales bacterium]|jgi:hypothetical protein|nr:hypothetical protein [Pirellulales bacterium]
MNRQLIVLLTAWCIGAAIRLSAAPFQDLDFEQATIHSPPANYVPNGNAIGLNPISAAAAFPFWTAQEDSTICTAVWGGGGALDETSVALLDASGFPKPIDGNYSLELSAYADAPSGSGLYKASSISQTGDIPANAKSILILLRGVGPPANVRDVPTVTINGNVINMITLSSSSGVMTMAGDVSAFAGTSAQFTIQAAGVSGQGTFLAEDYIDIDDISFSPNPVPEPGAVCLALGCVGVVLLRFRRNAA